MSDTIPQKRCPVCKQFKPAINDYFSSNKNSSDHLEPRCKDCRKLARPRKTPALESVPDGHKRCRQCKEALPATKEHFYSNKGRPDNLTDYCKTCLQSRYRKHPPK